MQNTGNYRQNMPPPMAHHAATGAGGQQQQSGPYANQNAHMRPGRPMNTRYVSPHPIQGMFPVAYTLPSTPGQPIVAPIYPRNAYPAQHTVQQSQPIISPPYYQVQYMQGSAPPHQAAFYTSQVQFSNRHQLMNPVSYQQVHPQSHSHVQTISQPQQQQPQQHQPQPQNPQPISVPQQSNPSHISQATSHVQQQHSIPTAHYSTRVEQNQGPTSGRPGLVGTDPNQGGQMTHNSGQGGAPIPVQPNKDPARRQKRLLVFTDPSTGEKVKLDNNSSSTEEASSSASAAKDDSDGVANNAVPKKAGPVVSSSSASSEPPEVSVAGIMGSSSSDAHPPQPTPVAGGMVVPGGHAHHGPRHPHNQMAHHTAAATYHAHPQHHIIHPSSLDTTPAGSIVVGTNAYGVVAGGSNTGTSSVTTSGSSPSPSNPSGGGGSVRESTPTPGNPTADDSSSKRVKTEFFNKISQANDKTKSKTDEPATAPSPTPSGAGVASTTPLNIAASAPGSAASNSSTTPVPHPASVSNNRSNNNASGGNNNIIEDSTTPMTTEQEKVCETPKLGVEQTTNPVPTTSIASSIPADVTSEKEGEKTQAVDNSSSTNNNVIVNTDNNTAKASTPVPMTTNGSSSGGSTSATATSSNSSTATTSPLTTTDRSSPAILEGATTTMTTSDASVNVKTTSNSNKSEGNFVNNNNNNVNTISTSNSSSNKLEPEIKTVDTTTESSSTAANANANNCSEEPQQLVTPEEKQVEDDDGKAKVVTDSLEVVTGNIGAGEEENRQDDEELVRINNKANNTEEEEEALVNGGEKFEDMDKDNVPLSENSHELSTTSISPTPIENYCNDNSARSQDDSFTGAGTISVGDEDREVGGAIVEPSGINNALGDEDELEDGEIASTNEKEEEEENEADHNEENEAPKKPTIKQYDRDDLLRIGQQTKNVKSKVDIPIADVIKANNGKPNSNYDMMNNFSQNRGTPSRPPGGRGGHHLPRMMTPILRNFPQPMNMNWQMGQPLTIPPQPPPQPPRIIDLAKTPVQLSKDPNAWRPNRRGREESDANPDEKQTDVIVKQTRGILNKLTPENFDKLCDKFLKLELNDRQDRISAVIKVVFEKAIDEPNFSQAYAKMVKHVCQHSQETAKKFRKEILDQCQKEFQKTNRDEDEITQKEKDIQAAQDGKEKNELKLELDDFRTKMRRRSLGNVRFIGELFKLQMLTPKIMVDCVQMLIGNSDEESYECLCKLLTTVGQMLENALRDQELRIHDCKKRNLPIPKFVPEDNYMDKTIKKLRQLSNDTSKLSSRIRFALLDLIELRESKWVPRRDSNAPKTIDEVRRDAIREEQEEKRQINALPEINPSHLANRRPNPLNQNQSSQLKKGEWTVQTTKSNRFVQIKKSTEPSNSPVLAPPGVGGWGQSSFNRNVNMSKLPPRFQPQQQQAQQQSQGGLPNRFMPSLGVTGGNRFDSLSPQSSDSPVGGGLNLMGSRGGGGSTGGPSSLPSHVSSQNAQSNQSPTISSSARQRSSPPLSTSSSSSNLSNSNNTSSVPSSARDVPPQPQPVGEDVREKVKNIFQEYLSVQNSEDTLFWIKERFPSDKVLTFVDELSRVVVEMSKEQEQVGAGKLIKLLIKNNVVRRDQVLDVLVKGVVPDIPDILMDAPKVSSYMAMFILEVFGEESSLDWLLELSHPLNNEDYQDTHTEIITATLNLFRLKRNEQHVKSLWAHTKKKAASVCEHLPWLGEEPRNSLVTKMVSVLNKNQDNKEIVNIFKENSWDVRESEVSSALLLATCEVSYVSDNKSWDVKKLETLLKLLLNRPPPDSLSSQHLWAVAKDFIKQKEIGKEPENTLWTLLLNANLITNKEEC